MEQERYDQGGVSERERERENGGDASCGDGLIERERERECLASFVGSLCKVKEVDTC